MHITARAPRLRNTVSSGTLNSTIPYHQLAYDLPPAKMYARTIASAATGNPTQLMRSAAIRFLGDGSCAPVPLVASSALKAFPRL